MYKAYTIRRQSLPATPGYTTVVGETASEQADPLALNHKMGL
jgi:hypothetical protein